MNKKILIAVIALVVVLGTFLGIYLGTRPDVDDSGEGGSVQVTTDPDTTGGDATDENGTTEGPAQTWKYTITVTVVHKNGESKDFTYQTNESYLGPVILDTGLVEGDMGDFGLYIHTVDGETADWNVDQGWWALYEGDQQAMTGADGVVLTDGGVYKLVYTCGY